MDISIVIVSWKVKEKLRKNLEALRQSTGVSFDTFVIDNDSQDGTVEMIKREFPSVMVIANAENVGFAKASNQGMRQASGRYILLLNPDMLLEPDTLKDSVAWLDKNPQAAIAGIKLRDEKREIIRHVRRFPHLLDQLAIILKLPHLFPHLLDAYLRKDFDYEKASSVDSIRGAFFMIRRSTIEQIGLLDERYFLWFEEVDYCRQARAKGLEVWYTPAAKATDYIGQSFNQLKRSTKQSYFKDSMIAYFKKWHSGQDVLIIFAWEIGNLITIVADTFNFKSRTRT